MEEIRFVKDGEVINTIVIDETNEKTFEGLTNEVKLSKITKYGIIGGLVAVAGYQVYKRCKKNKIEVEEIPPTDEQFDDNGDFTEV